ncbi:hypothetical protein LCI18_000655 [Fusarium solani-melongenae]|uniref:Uncharacterized protein n=1 Tax=Fusarium solani subsp. cucurbitae TaxID=2747967 RepID=A0ACD3YLD5_FUSSC|nr:hypothetical protein LCI18_000655 [Fusarium solani-melongenae]
MADPLRDSDQDEAKSAESGHSQLDQYSQQLVDRLHDELKDNLLAVHLFGSAGYSAYQPGISDVDVYAIIHEPISDYRHLSEIISHHALPCPARKLEFVLFTKANAAQQAPDPKFEMNFNTGMGMEDYINLDSQTEPRFWFLLDIAVGRELGKSIFGPPPDTLFAAPSSECVFDCMIESLAWHRQNGPVDHNGILNACRQLRYDKTSIWGSKKDGGNWVLEHYDHPNIVTLAMDARHSETQLPPDLGADFLDFVEDEIKRDKVSDGQG